MKITPFGILLLAWVLSTGNVIYLQAKLHEKKAENKQLMGLVEEATAVAEEAVASHLTTNLGE